MLYQRKLWLERMKAKGLIPETADIDFSKAWKVEEVKYQKEADIDENGELEEVQPDEEPETQPDEEPETQPEGQPEEQKGADEE
jgi:hypothetical protein